ncbi:hypothetical protein BJ944DRAFT_260081 [Cunninghamella echinulata]|nr:hypothetical protein BJ944DRAFT_260081 [Cunninghamella echinulata]
MYIRSSIIAVLLVTTFISTNSVQAFGPQDFSPFGSGGSGEGSGSGGGSGMAGALSTQKFADDVGNTVTDLLKLGNGGASQSQMDKRYDESGDGVAMSSGQQQDSLPQKAVDLMNDLSSGGSMVIKRGEEGKKSHGNKKNNNNKRRRHNNKKNNGEPSFATMPTSLRRRSGLIPLPGSGGGAGGGLGGLAGGLSGKSAAPSADPPAGGFKMALIGSRKRGLGNSGRQGNSDLVKEITGAVGITDDPIGKSDSPINAGGLKLSLRDLSGVDGLVDDVTGALGGSDSGYPPSSHHYHDLHAADYSDGSIEGPQLGVLDHLQGGASGAGPLGGGGASKLGMDGKTVSGPKIDILKRRSLNQLSASDRMARAKQGVVVDNDNEQQHEAMKRDSSGNGGNNGMMGGNGGNNGMMSGNGNGGQNPPSFSPSSSSSSNDPQYNEHSFMTSDSDKKEKKKGGGGFSMALVDLPIRRRQLGPLGGDDKSGGGLSKLTGDDGLVGSILGGLGGGGNVANEKESINRIEQKSTSPSHQFTTLNGSDQLQDAAIDTPQYDLDMPQPDADMEQYGEDMPTSEMNMGLPDSDMPPSDQNNFFDDSQADPNDAPYNYDDMGQQ